MVFHLLYKLNSLNLVIGNFDSPENNWEQTTFTRRIKWKCNYIRD